MKHKVWSFVISIAIALAVGGISALLTRNSMNIYDEITVPPAAPPAFLFPIVWTVLFILMGISAAIIYTSESTPKEHRQRALTIYALSLGINFMWSIIFFNFRAFLTAFAVLLLLLFLIIRTIVAYFRISPTAAYLQIPYALWVTFAGYLNFAIWILNR